MTSDPVTHAAPALVSKLIGGTKRWAPVDQYITSNRKIDVIHRTLDGSTSAERAAQVRHLSALRPMLKRVVDHWCISLHPDLGHLSALVWRRIALEWLRGLGYGDGIGALVVRHGDRPHDHIHIAVCRVRFDGSVVNDSFIARRANRLASEIAKDLGFPTPPRRAKHPSPANAAVKAGLRARRHNNGSFDVTLLTRSIRAAAARSSSAEDLFRHLREAQVEVRLSFSNTGTARGWSLRRVGSDEWVSGSHLCRDLALPRLLRSLGGERELPRVPGYDVNAERKKAADTKVHPRRAIVEGVLNAEIQGLATEELEVLLAETIGRATVISRVSTTTKSIPTVETAKERLRRWRDLLWPIASRRRCEDERRREVTIWLLRAISRELFRKRLTQHHQNSAHMREWRIELEQERSETLNRLRSIHPDEQARLWSRWRQVRTAPSNPADIDDITLWRAFRQEVGAARKLLSNELLRIEFQIDLLTRELDGLRDIGVCDASGPEDVIVDRPSLMRSDVRGA